MGIEMFFSKPVKECIKESRVKRGFKGKIRGMIVPHAGYMYSGVVAAAAYRLLKRGDYDRAIIMGPLHGSVENEHSVKVQIPFLEYMLGKIEIVTILHGLDGDLTREVKELEKRVDERTLVVASSDLSHYLRQEEAERTDQMTIKSILNMKADFIEACGKEAILVINGLAKLKGWKPHLVDYKTSGEITGDFNSVVGYAGIVYIDNVIANPALPGMKQSQWDRRGTGGASR